MSRFSIPREGIEVIADELNAARQRVDALHRIDGFLFEDKAILRQLDKLVRDQLRMAGCPEAEVERWVRVIYAAADRRRRLDEMEPEGRA